ncbi:hypothetical protein GZL_07472 [Streptomyces sp. 769]|nr:hypothetical protein GZL_07472 [Streptomyces sp. 769]
MTLNRPSSQRSTMSNQHQTLADVLASDQAQSSVRSAP